MKDLVHRFRVWCCLTYLRAKGPVIGLIVLMNPRSSLKCVCLDFGMLPALDLIVCTERVGPTCCFGIRFVGLVVMA